MPYRFALIHNPLAGKKKAEAVTAFQDACEKAGVHCQIYATRDDCLPYALATQAIQDGATAVVAAGGDGTVNQVGKACFEAQVPLGILPVGSGNDIARSYGFSLDTDASIARILCKKTRQVDVGFAGEHFFLNIASMGFDADVVARKKELPPWVSPSMGYRLSVILMMLTYKEQVFKIMSSAFSTKQRGLLCAVGIGRYYGGGVEILPDAKVDDGIFSVRFIEKLSIRQRFVLLPALQFGNHLQKFPMVHTFEDKTVRIVPDLPMYLNIDGELVPEMQEVTFTLKQQALTILTD